MSKAVFVGGATGYTGQRLLPLLQQKGISTLSWHRPSSKSKQPIGNIVAAAQSDVESLAEAMRSCDTVVQLIGTTRAQFDAQTSYESVDIGTTTTLLEAAKRAGSIQKFVLLSSVGAGKPVGPYLQAKYKTEQLVVQSGLPYILVRPSVITGPGRVSGEFMRPLVQPWDRLLPILQRYRPIRVQQLAELLAIACEIPSAECQQGQIWEGRTLWEHLH